VRRRRRSTWFGSLFWVVVGYFVIKYLWHHRLQIGLIIATAIAILIVLLFLAKGGQTVWDRWRQSKRPQPTLTAHIEIVGGDSTFAGESTPTALEQLLVLDPYQFEEVVAQFLATQGFVNVTRVGGAGDRGVDIVGYDDGDQKVIVQCKRYQLSHRVGSQELQLFLGALTIHQAEYGIFVTTSTYTQTAQALAKQHLVHLIDGFQLSSYLQGSRSLPERAEEMG